MMGRMAFPLEFLKEKFTNKELYAWMVKTLSKILYGFYNLAYTAARMAQATLRILWAPHITVNTKRKQRKQDPCWLGLWILYCLARL